MARTRTDDEGEYRLNVRFPIDLGLKVKALAEVNRRSINNEILCLVEGGVKANEKGA